jgi:hypothetical protein
MTAPSLAAVRFDLDQTLSEFLDDIWSHRARLTFSMPLAQLCLRAARKAATAVDEGAGFC